MIGVINFGLGNLGSLVNIYRKNNYEIKILDHPNEISKVSHLILPGVGSFRQGMKNLVKDNWDKEIYRHVEKEKPLLGICLGMHLLFEYGEEDGSSKGLGLLKGKVVKINTSDKNQKIPIIGWKDFKVVKEHILLKNVRTKADYYFIHSYECITKNKNDLIAHSDNIAACVTDNKNIFATQFHPEKSPPNGITILENFFKWNGKC